MTHQDAWQTGVKSRKANFHVQHKTLEHSLQSLLDSLAAVLSAYYEARKMLIASGVQNSLRSAKQWSESLKEVPWKKLLLAILPYLGYFAVFKFYQDFRHATHLDDVSPPHYAVLSHIEYALFFCYPHRILSRLANPVFDLLAAVPYLIHFPLPFLFAAYLAINPKRRPALFPMLWCAGWVNLIAVLIQATYPTAPPWFTDSAVLDENGNLIYEVPCEAGFHRLDKLLGVSIFHGIYSKSPVKFGAFPSLHVAWPMIVFVNRPWFGKKVAAVHVIWILLAALYSTHHYLIDALGGILLVVIVRLAMLKLWSPFPEPSSEGEEERNASSKLKKSFNQNGGLIQTV